MAGVYRITEQELRFLLMFTENRGLYGFGDMPQIETREEAYQCVETLCEKGYLNQNVRKEYEVDMTLELILTAGERPYGYLIMEDLRQEGLKSKSAVYLLEDVIAMVEQKEKEYELMWLPYLPLAIGEVAELHTPFLNRETTVIKEMDARECLKAGFGWQWEVWGRQLEDEEESFRLFILSDGREQLMVKEWKEPVHVSKPDKADYVNAMTGWLAYIHGKAIKKMLQEG